MAPPLTETELAHLRPLGRVWDLPGSRRLYFTDLPTLYGLTLDSAGPGEPAAVRLHGVPVSTEEGQALWQHVADATLYVDLEDGQLHSLGLHHDVVAVLVAAIRGRMHATTWRGEQL